MIDPSLFSSFDLPGAVVADLQRLNPWWQGLPQPLLPQFRRWPFARVARHLSAEQVLAPILVLRGPRQVGKTTLQQQVIQDALAAGMNPRRILRVQFDELPSFKTFIRSGEGVLRLVEWFERSILGQTLNASAHQGETAFLFLDEVQNIADWDVQLKSLVDAATVRCVVTGSSALRIEKGRDSLAGRISTLELGPLRLTEIAAIRRLGDLPPYQSGNGLTDWTSRKFWQDLRSHGHHHTACRRAAFSAFAQRGGYPMAHVRDVPWADLANQLNETIIKRVIQHDLRIGERGRKRDEQLLQEVFRLCCRYAGQAPSPRTLADEVRATLDANVGPDRIRQYQAFLDSSLLVRLVLPLEIRLKKRKGYAKICLSDHALRAAWLQEVVEIEPNAAPDDTGLVGRIADSATGQFLSSISGVELAYVPEGADQPEVDFVVTVGEHRIPIEVKYRRRIDETRDLAGLEAFIAKQANRAGFGIVIVANEDFRPASPNLIAIPLSTLLLLR